MRYIILFFALILNLNGVLAQSPPPQEVSPCDLEFVFRHYESKYRDETIFICFDSTGSIGRMTNTIGENSPTKEKRHLIRFKNVTETDEYYSGFVQFDFPIFGFTETWHPFSFSAGEFVLHSEGKAITYKMYVPK